MNRHALFALLLVACGTEATVEEPERRAQTEHLSQITLTPPSPERPKEIVIDGQHSFAMTLVPLPLLDFETRVALENVSRALIDPVAFVLDGIVLIEDGHPRRHGLCPLIAEGPKGIADCTRDLGVALNALLDVAFARSQTAQDLRETLAHAGRAIQELHLEGTVTLRTESGHAGALAAEIVWDRVVLDPNDAPIDLRAQGLSPFSAILKGEAVVKDDAVELNFEPAAVRARFAELVLSVIERAFLARLLPALDLDHDGAVSLGEIFAALIPCDGLTTELKIACEASAPAIATLVHSGILTRITTELPGGFDVTMQATLSEDAFDATLTFAGVDEEQTVDLQIQN